MHRWNFFLTSRPGIQGVQSYAGNQVTRGIGYQVPQTRGNRSPTGTCGGSNFWDSEDLSMQDTPQARWHEGLVPGAILT